MLFRPVVGKFFPSLYKSETMIIISKNSKIRHARGVRKGLAEQAAALIFFRF